MCIINIVVGRCDNICRIENWVDWVGIELWDAITRSVNRLHVDNLEPSGIRGDLVEILVDVNTKTMNIYIKKS